MASQIGKICAANPKIGILVIVHIYVVLAITHTIAIKFHVAFVWVDWMKIPIFQKNKQNTIFKKKVFLWKIGICFQNWKSHLNSIGNGVKKNTW